MAFTLAACDLLTSIVVCGGHISNIGASFQSPNYPSNYPNGVTCIWQIMANEPFEIKFEYFKTYDNHDKVEVWNSLTSLEGKNNKYLFTRLIETLYHILYIHHLYSSLCFSQHRALLRPAQINTTCSYIILLIFQASHVQAYFFKFILFAKKK